MRKALKTVLSLFYRSKMAVIGATSAAIVTEIPEAKAQSTTGIGGVAAIFNGQLININNTVMGVSFIAGLVFVGLGLMKLKQAADSQGQSPYGAGIWRLVVGGGLVGLPAMAAIFRDTESGGAAQTINEGTATVN